MNAVCHHMHIVCRDLEPVVAFFQEGFGVPLIGPQSFGGAPGAAMDLGGGVLLYIVQRNPDPLNPDKPVGGWDHIGLQVENLEAALDHLKSLPGVRVTKEPFNAGALRCAFVAGPENILVEVVQDTSAS